MIHQILTNIDAKMLKTDEQIIFAAMKVFSRYPLEVATLRMIAKEADVTLSLITYHFKTKENLYQEVLARVLPQITEAMHDQFRAIQETGLPSFETAKNLLRNSILSAADKLYGNPNLNLLGQIIMREHFAPSPMYKTLYEQYFKKVLDSLALLITAITGETDNRKVSLQAFSILGQMISIAFQREMMMRYLGLQNFSEHETNELKDLVIHNIFAQLGVDVKTE
jgi:AcrR family transcriptional regulator